MDKDLPMDRPLRVLVVGCGNMGASHARAYHRMPEFEIVGLVSRGPASRGALERGARRRARVRRLRRRLSRSTRPDVVSINTYPETHGPYARAALDAGCHVFCEKPLATTVEEAQAIVDAARARDRKLVVGYILRVHPAWARFIEIARTLGKPLVMRMNLNQQSHGEAWQLAPQPDGLDEPDRRLRRALRRRHVPDDRRPAGARLGDRRAPHRAS